VSHQVAFVPFGVAQDAVLIVAAEAVFVPLLYANQPFAGLGRAVADDLDRDHSLVLIGIQVQCATDGKVVGSTQGRAISRGVVHAQNLIGVTFETGSGTQTLTATKILQHPGYDVDSNNDLAIVWLSGTAPVLADRYDIYRDSDEIGQAFNFSGYGRTGTGSTGATRSDTATPIRLKASNQFDADAATLKSYLGSGMAWTPLSGTQLIADFDNGTSTNDALGQLIYRYDTGRGLDEGLIASGDSGGPAFLQNKLAGVASYTASLTRGSINPDIDSSTNSSFGEIAAWQRVSAYQQWIDQSLRANYPNAPTKPEEVKKEVAEGNSGTSFAYFLVQFTGVRSDLWRFRGRTLSALRQDPQAQLGDG
jgi:hypothetical protein